MRSDYDILIVGTGQAGFQCAASLRQQGFAGTIAMVGEERGLPYQRPPLSKAYLKETAAERLLFRDADYFTRSAIDVFDGVRADRIDRTDRRLVLGDGRAPAYGHLVLATGTRNRKPRFATDAIPGVLDLRTLHDADVLREGLHAATRMVVIGGGFIGLEVAATARQLGKDVTLLEAAGRLMERSVSSTIAAHCVSVHRSSGIDIRLGTMAARLIAGHGGVAGVELAGGELVEADLVLVATGVQPNVELAEAAGLDVGDGIRVDRYLSTSDPDISAIGDCAEFLDFDGSRRRLESVQNAVDQAKFVALRLTAGAAEPYRAVPWFWSDQGSLKLQMVGVAPADCRFETARAGDDQMTALGFSSGRLACVETVNASGEFMAARRLLETGARISEPDLATFGFRFSDYFRHHRARANA